MVVTATDVFLPRMQYIILVILAESLPDLVLIVRTVSEEVEPLVLSGQDQNQDQGTGVWRLKHWMKQCGVVMCVVRTSKLQKALHIFIA